MSNKLSFNPRTHTACDHRFARLSSTKSCFNPRTHTACDEKSGEILDKVYKFQSTHAHGVRLRFWAKDRYEALFQSTHAHGVRHHNFSVINHNWLFQSTHAHGVRRDNFSSAGCVEFVSIHARTRRATRQTDILCRQAVCFNPRTHTACDCNIANY